MTVAFIYVGTVIAYMLLLTAFLLKDYTIAMLSGIAIFCVGIYVSIYNVENITNLLTEAFGLISIMLGAYVFINSSKEKIEELM